MRVLSNAKTSERMNIPTTDHYLLKHAHVPRPLLGHQAAQFPVAEGLAAFDNLVLVDLEIREGRSPQFNHLLNHPFVFHRQHPHCHQQRRRVCATCSLPASAHSRSAAWDGVESVC